MLTFLSPFALLGLLSAAIPLLIHLSRSRRTKKMRFSTTRFFTDEFLRSYRMSKLKELLLLACRMALFAFFAIALAKPLLRTPSQPLVAGQDRAVVVVLDNSASMGHQIDGVALLEKAKTSARAVLGGLGPNDSANLILAGRRADDPDVLFPEMTMDQNAVTSRLEAVRVAPLGTDLSGAVAKAETLLESSTAPSKEIYVFSDLQDSGWEIRQNKNIVGAELQYFFVKVRPNTPSADLAITAVRHGSTRPMVGVPFAIQPHVRNQGLESRVAEAKLFVHDARQGEPRKVGERRLGPIASNRWAVTTFHHTFTTGGWHTGYVEVDDPHLSLNNRRYFAVQVLDALQVLAVNGAPSGIAARDELFFLRAALSAQPEGPSPIQVQTIIPDELANTDWAKFPLVLLANVTVLTPTAVEKLEQYVDGGGNLFVFLGDRIDSNFYNQFLQGADRLHGGLLPARLSSLTSPATPPMNATKEEPVVPAANANLNRAITSVDYDHPALAPFEDPRFANLTGIHVEGFWRLQPDSQRDARVLMSVGDAPLLCEKTFGKGKVLLFASSCDRDWTSFPVRPAYLPWIYRMISYLAQQRVQESDHYNTGNAVPLLVSSLEGLPRLQVRKPDQSIAYPTEGDDTAPLVFKDTDQTGIYQVFPLAKPNDARPFAVNLESFESDLTFLDDVLAGEGTGNDRRQRVQEGLSELLGGKPLATYVEDPDRVLETSLQARRGVRLWDMLLAAVLVIALFEPWYANRISARHYALPTPQQK